MELDNMKELWQKMDETIQKQNTFNEQILKRMLHQNLGSTFKKITNVEYINMVATILLFTILAVQAGRFGNDAKLLWCYIFMMATGLASLIFSWYKIRFLSGLEAGQTPVVTLAEKTERFRLLISKERMIFIVTGPALIFTFYAVMAYLINDTNIFTKPVSYIPMIITGVVSYLILLVLVYNMFYFRNIRSIKNNLKEIEEFRKS